MLTQEQIQHYTNRDFIYDQSPCGLLSFQADGSIIASNQTISEWTGINTMDLAQMNFRFLLEHPSMLYYDLIINPLISLKNHISEFSLRFLSFEGGFDALLNAAVYRNSQGKILVINASVQKISDRKKYEKELLLETRKAEEQREIAESERRRFEFLFNSVPNKIWTLDAKGAILNMNARASTFFNILRPIHNTAFAAVSKQDRARSIVQWKTCLASGSKFERELRLSSEDEMEKWFLISAEPYYNGNGEIEVWFCSATNIHRKKMLQIANQQELKSNLSSAYKDLDEKSGLLAELALDQSHMVRKPLANILGLAKLMQIENDPASARELLELLLVSATELDEMIRNVSAKSTLRPQYPYEPNGG